MITGYYSEIKWWMILLLCLIIAISPVVALFLAVILYRHKVSYLLLIIFAFHFGWFYEPRLDLLVHYNQFKLILGKSLAEQWIDPHTIAVGKEAYPVIFKYIVGQITDNPNFFSACAMLVYSSVFCCLLYNLREYYTNKMTPLKMVIFLGVIFTVEYQWFLGLRFWTGAFVWTIFYLKYVTSCKIKYLFLSFSAMLFHFSLVFLPGIAFVNLILRDNYKCKIILVIISFISRIVDFNPFTYIPQLLFLKGYIKDASFNKNIIKSVNERFEMFRTSGNVFYIIRNDVLFLGLALVFYFLYKNDKGIFEYNRRFLGLIITFYALVNFGYSNLIFYDRMYKLLILLFYIFMLMYVHNSEDRIIGKRLNLFLVLPLSASVLYAIMTIVISQREYLWKLEIWFNNFLF